MKPLNKISIRTLKKFFRLVRRARKIIPNVLVLVAAIAVTLALLYGAFFAARAAKAWIEQRIAERLAAVLQAQSEPAPASSEPQRGEPAPQEEPSLVERVIGFFAPPAEQAPPGANDARDLLLASFTDLFSGVGWIDQEKTTMAQDRTVTAFTFPPKVSWEKVSNSEMSDILRMSDIQRLTSSQQCIASQCLETRDNKLFLNGNGIALPAELQNNPGLTSLSAGALGTKWLVGAVVKTAQYESRIFQFDGDTFAPAFPSGAPWLASKYEGALGFGGADDDWVVVYGGYEGFAYRVTDGAVVEDLSHFFGARVMEGGFHPTVVRIPPSHISPLTSHLPLSDVTWCVGSETEGKPKLLKLFENGTGRVAGGVDLTQALFGDEGSMPAPRLRGQEAGVAAAFVAPSSSRGATLVVAVSQANGPPEYWAFTDLGFEKNGEREVVSVNLNRLPGEVKKAVVSELDLAPEGADVRFYLSNDGAAWEEATPGAELVFANEGGRRLYWKAVFAPKGSEKTSPFLDRIRIDYKVRMP